MTDNQVTPELLLNAYANGIFPMADSRDDVELFWVDPTERGILPFKEFHVPRSLKKLVRQEKFDVKINTAFRDVVRACAATSKGRDGTWISQTIEDLYCTLHDYGHTHSVECWKDNKLVGGLYGVSLAGGFFGESMFHTETDASKVALVHLVARLNVGGFTLLDTQFGTEHLAQFGVTEVSRQQYHQLLDNALDKTDADFLKMRQGLSGSTILQSITQTS